ncbi:MAG: hypothetical protein DRP87_05745 [Spirochaetes bacterium]|nr:MAG: hypothetical protein DRP87_05745 [Spirochaetota bacterium]
MNILILVLAFTFYVLIPGIGAFYVRSQWRRFRKNIISASLSPIVRYNVVREGTEGYLGDFRCTGSLEAIQENLIWIHSENISISVDLFKAFVYILPSFSFAEKEGKVELNEETLPDEMPRKVSWNRIFSLPEGTKMFVYGPLFLERGRAIFKMCNRKVVTVVIYDGGEDTILRRSIWGGRQINEYWNQFTPGSIAAGALSLFIVAYMLLKSPMLRIQALISLSLSGLPLSIFLPPGVFLFFLYRSLWRKARFFRAERDLLKLPVRYFKDISDNPDYLSAVIPTGEPYIMKRLAAVDAYRYHQELKDAKVRTSRLLKQSNRSTDDCYIFGVQTPGENGIRIGKPKDPMAELLIVPGNPVFLSSKCESKARTYELLAAAVFFTGLVINLFIVISLLALLIK